MMATLGWWLIIVVLHTSLPANSLSLDGFDIFVNEKEEIRKEIERNERLNLDAKREPLLPPFWQDVLKNYELIRNHTYVFFRNFDLIHHLQVETSPGKDFKHDRYLSYQEQCNWMSEAAFNAPRTTTAFSLGYTINNREICALFINSQKPDLALVWMDGNMAALTWLSSASLLSFANYLIFSQEATAVHLRTNHRFIIVPNLNPDGYRHSRRKERLWVKNRRKVSELPDCSGVNLNRNFDVGIHGPASGIAPTCSDLYGGEPFSELETQAVLLAFQSFTPIVSLSFQTYGQVWLLPYACSFNKPANYVEMDRVAQIAIRRIRRQTGALYIVGKASDVLQGTHIGTTFDWSNLKMGSRYSYGIRLRPSNAGNGGFQVDAKWIIPTGQDIIQGVFAVLRNADLTPQVPIGNHNDTDCK